MTQFAPVQGQFLEECESVEVADGFADGIVTYIEADLLRSR